MRTARVFLEQPVSVRLSYVLSRSSIINSCDKFSGRDDSGASGSAGQRQ